MIENGPAILVLQFLAWTVLVGLLGFTSLQLRRQHLAMNSRLDALLEVTGKLARAEGYKAGQDSRDKIREAGRHVTQGEANG